MNPVILWENWHYEVALLETSQKGLSVGAAKLCQLKLCRDIAKFSALRHGKNAIFVFLYVLYYVSRLCIVLSTTPGGLELLYKY